MYTMPHLLTVAGDATSKSIGSKIMLMTSLIAIISPDIRHNFLLCVEDVFMFSIKIASTRPVQQHPLPIFGLAYLRLRRVPILNRQYPIRPLDSRDEAAVEDGHCVDRRRRDTATAPSRDA